MLNRAYSLLEIKSVDDEKRIIEGIASTPRTDRQEDIVESTGAQFRLPIPMMWLHGKDPFVGQTPVGNVIMAQPTADGIPVRVQMEREDRPGRLKDILDFAWQAVQKRLVRGFSIGFRAIEDPEPIKGTFGLRFTKWEWLELSAVPIAANADATITTIKGIVNADDPAAAGADLRDSPQPVRGTGTAVRIALKGATTAMKPLSEQISAFEATRAAKSARMVEIMTKAGDEGVTLDATQSEEYDGLDGEVKSIDEHLTRLAALEKAQKASAKPVNGADPASAAASRNTSVIHVKDTTPPGIGFARAVMCKTDSFLRLMNGEVKSAVDIARERYPSDERVHVYLKATVAAGTTTDATWAGPLVDPANLASEFIEFLRPQTIIGKFGTNGIPSLNQIPFNVRITGQTSGGDAYWVGQAKPKPLTKFDFNAVTHGFAKVATIAVIAQELARFSSPSAEALVRKALAGAVIARIDTDFVDPDKGIVANVSPASITNNVAPIATAGSSAADVRVDVMAIFAPFIAANLTPTSGVWIMSHSTALALSLMKNALGQPEYPTLTMMGGTFQGLPVITSQYVRTGSPTTELVILVNADDIFLSDDGQVTVDASREASLEMLDSSLVQNQPTGASLVSLWQNNLIGLRAERVINWSKRRDGVVQFIENVTWGAGGGSPS